MNIRQFISIVGLCSLVTVSCQKTETAPGEHSGIYEGGRKTVEMMSPEEIESVAFIPGEAVIRLSEEMVDRIERCGVSQVTGSGELASVCKELGVSSMERLFPDAGEYEPRTRKEGLHRFYHVRFSEGIPISTAKTAFEKVKGVDSFEAQHRVYSTAVVNDEKYSSLWGLHGSYGIDVEKVWEYTMGDPSVSLCVVDDGIQYDHPDLEWNMGQASNCFNFVRNKAQIVPGDHATHVAGTIAGVGNNSIGVVGIAGGNYAENKKGITLINAQVFQGRQSASNFAPAIKWGADHGAVISQNSWGYIADVNDDGRVSQAELENYASSTIDSSIKSAIDYFIKYAGCDNNGEQKADSPMKGGLVVFAAGNESIPYGLPASYAPVLSVSATTKAGSVASYSNYGSWVNICAPGSGITSTVTNSKYDTYDGTSMACPHVSGTAALLLSFFGGEGFTPDDLKGIIIDGAKKSFIKTNGHECGPFLNAWNSFELGVERFNKRVNDPPVISTDYTGNFVFRHWEKASIPFLITDPDGDKVDVSYETDGKAQMVEGSNGQWSFSLYCDLVQDSREHNFKIIATDRFKASSEYEFKYKVLENRAPEVKKGLEGLLLGAGESSDKIDLTELFTDPDEETLKFTVTSSNPGLVGVDIKGNEMTVTGKVQGVATIKATAMDHMGLKATTTFDVMCRQDKNSYEVYPNPVTDCLYIRTGLTEERVNVTLTSSTGLKVYSGTVSCSVFNPGKVDFTSFAPGTYTLEIERAGVKTERSIVKI